MHGLELILVLLAVVAVLAEAARRLSVPYPIFLVLGGLGLSLIPGLAHVELEPEIVFLLFLPPILFSAAYYTSWRDFRANARPIGLLSVGCILATTVAVAAVARWAIPEMNWATAFVLGAIVSPPDAAAATTVFQRLGAPRRLVTVLEGESLVNDASALVAYRFAVTAVVSGAFSLGSAGGRFLLVVAGGVAIGFAVGWLLTWIMRRLDDPPIEIMVTLLAPVAAYLPAEEIGVSGVLATVTAGLYFARQAPLVLSSAGRLRGVAVWEFVVFLVNGLIFILIGLQLREIVAELEDRPFGELIGQAVVICLTVIVVRILWVFPATYLPRFFSARIRERDPYPPWGVPMIVSWAGLRGVVSLAAALALPLTTDAGDPFPFRGEILFFTFCVILVTLVGQGLSLPWLVERLGVHDDGEAHREELLARRRAASAAVARIDELIGDGVVPLEDAQQLRTHYEHVLRQIPASLNPAEKDHDHIDAHIRLRQEAIRAERMALVALRNRGEIGDETLHNVERELDLAEGHVKL